MEGGGQGQAQVKEPMVEERSEFRIVMDQVREGSDEAIWRLIEDYGPHIKRVVRRKLDRRMRSKFDSIDFVQMVWASFFRNPDGMCSFDHPQDFVRYLASLAKHKVIEEYRRRIQTQKYNVRRECSLQDSEVVDHSVAGHQATPSQIAIARERYEKILSDQPERNRSVVQMRIGGATYDEIGRHLGIHERTARKIIHRLVEPQ